MADWIIHIEAPITYTETSLAIALTRELNVHVHKIWKDEVPLEVAITEYGTEIATDLPINEYRLNLEDINDYGVTEIEELIGTYRKIKGTTWAAGSIAQLEDALFRRRNFEREAQLWADMHQADALDRARQLLREAGELR